MNKYELKSFWRFVARRQRAWYRKEQLGQRPPWSKDPILQKAHFTNVYRELDPGTKYTLFTIQPQSIDATDMSFWLLFYRYTGSNPAAFDHVPMSEVEKYNEHKIINRLRKLDNPFGNAYLVYPMTNEQTGKDKVELVVSAFGDIADVWRKHWPKIQQAKDPERAYKLIRESRTGIGPFSAYQTWIDYCMLGLIEDWRNDWVMPGPGAIRGASIIWGEKLSAKATAGACMDLWYQMPDAIDFDKPMWETVGHQPFLSDIQNCLCEYQKYVRVRDTGRVTRSYAKS